MNKYLISILQIFLVVIIAIIVFFGLILYWIWAGSGFFILGNLLVILPIIFLLFCKYYKINVIKHNEKVALIIILIGAVLTIVNIFQLKSIIVSSFISCGNGSCSSILTIPDNINGNDLKQYTFDLSYVRPLIMGNNSSVASFVFENGYILDRRINFGDGTRAYGYHSDNSGDIWIDGSEFQGIFKGKLNLKINPFLYNFDKITLYKFKISRPEFLIKIFQIIGLTSK